MPEKQILDTEQLTKADIDIFTSAGRIPVFSIKDVIDAVNHLTVVLTQRGLLPDHDTYLDSFEDFVESKIHLGGTVQIRAYTFYDKPSTIIIGE